MPKLSASEARDLLYQRIKAREAGDLTALNRLDRQISSIVNAGDWPTTLIRTDSAPAYPRYQAQPKSVSAEGSYLKPRNVSWE